MSEFKERAALQTENKADADPVLTDGAKQKKRRRRAGKRKLKTDPGPVLQRGAKQKNSAKGGGKESWKRDTSPSGWSSCWRWADSFTAMPRLAARRFR